MMKTTLEWIFENDYVISALFGPNAPPSGALLVKAITKLAFQKMSEHIKARNARKLVKFDLALTGSGIRASAQGQFGP